MPRVLLTLSLLLLLVTSRVGAQDADIVFHLLIIPHCQMSPKFLKLLKKGHENVSRETLGNRVPDSICA